MIIFYIFGTVTFGNFNLHVTDCIIVVSVTIRFLHKCFASMIW